MNDFTQTVAGIEQSTDSITDENFLRSTYNHLLGAVVAFIALEYILFASGVAAVLAPIMTSNWLFVLGGFMLLGWVTSYFTNKRTDISGQYIQMAVTVALQALIFIPLLAYAVYYTDPSLLTNAVLVTLIIFTALTGIVGYTKANFSFLGPFLGIIGIVALIAIVGSVLFSVTLGFYFSLAMVVFAAGTVLYQTSKIKYEYGPGQHVAAGTALFASVALLFYYVLMSFVSRD